MQNIQSRASTLPVFMLKPVVLMSLSPAFSTVLARGYFICIGSGSGFLSALIKLYLHPLHPYIHWIDGWMDEVD